MFLMIRGQIKFGVKINDIIKGYVRYIFASLFFKSKRKHLSN